jgi:hypothetical protein
MMKNKDLSIPDDNRVFLIRYWLILAVLALAAAGIYSLPPVILRGPFFANILPVEHIFATSLVLHVDLSVLVWFLSMCGVLWSFLADSKKFWIYKISFLLAATGTLLIALSPFFGETNPLKNNYIPVLQNAAFFIGLSIFACGIIFQVFLTLSCYRMIQSNILNYGIYISALIALIALICFIISHLITDTPNQSNALYYYETIFWGGGHVLQYCFTTSMLVSWLWMSDVIGIKKILSNKQILVLLLVNILITLPSPLFYLLDDSGYLFTLQMRYGGGISALVIGGTILASYLYCGWNKTMSHNIKVCLILSIILFGYGGLLGYMISGINVTIPAHYHGSIVAITLAFIGLSYYLLPKLGFGNTDGKIATCQPYIYGLGQIIHITGLAWMGGYGALRKSAASSHEISNIFPKLMFFIGGSLAILGGLLFIIVVFRSLLRKSNSNNQ